MDQCYNVVENILLDIIQYFMWRAIGIASLDFDVHNYCALYQRVYSVRIDFITIHFISETNAYIIIIVILHVCTCTKEVYKR